MKKIFPILVLVAFSTIGCTKLNEKWYSSVTADTYYTSKESVYAALARPFTHWRWFQTNHRFYLSELTTDEFCCPQRGQHWEDGGMWRRLHYHQWTPSDNSIYETWRGVGMGIAMAYAIKDDLSALDYESLGLTEADKQDHLNQMQTLVAYFYLKGLDYFGGMPIYTASSVTENPRSTAKETYSYIEKWLKEAIPNLPAKVQGDVEDGFIRQATAASLLAELYFNAETYVGESHWEECAQICQDIIDGKYGYYALESTPYGPFRFDNEYSTENIWSAVSDNTHYNFSWYYNMFYPYNAYNYFNMTAVTGSNGFCLQPSLKPNGQPYDFNLGMPFSKFNDKDIRKQKYAYTSSTNYQGMFLMGELKNPVSGTTCTGTVEYMGVTLTLVDQIARFSEIGTTYASKEDLPSTITSGEESSGIRLVKFPMPNTTDVTLRWNPDYPVIRLAEIYYMLAECKYRLGKSDEAATLFNKVRARNFTAGKDPNPVTAENIDKYRILDEWMIEFLGESRRRTDLLRWDCYTSEDWWDHKATKDDHLKRFPVPLLSISSSNVLKQNPGYDGGTPLSDDEI